MGFLTWLGAKFSRTQVVKPVPELEAPPLYLQHTRVGGSLTPEDVSSILREADTGYMYHFVDLFNESRQKDCHLQTVLWTRESTVASLNWEITAASDSAEDRKIADFCTDWMSNFGTETFADDEEEPKDLYHLLCHQMAADSFGYSVSETLWAKDGGYVYPRGAVPISHRRFVYELTKGRVQFWDVFGGKPYPGVDLMAEYPGRFVLSQPRINGDVQAREGLARLLVWAALFRTWGISDWMKLAELAWKPWRVGTYKKTGGVKEDRAALLNALQSLTTMGVAALPDTTSIEVAWAKNRGESQHATLAAFLAAEMSKAVLGATLTVEQGKIGSNALGNVHNEVRHDIRDACARVRAADIRRTMIWPAVKLNFGSTARCPGFRLFPPPTIDKVGTSEAILNCANAGLSMPADWARTQIGCPKPEVGDELVGGGTYGEPPPEPAPGDEAKPKGLPVKALPKRRDAA